MKIIVAIIVTSLLISCSQRQSVPEDPKLIEQMPIRETVDDFKISFPAGWQRIRDPKQVQQRVVWSIYSRNDYVWTDQPEFAAWDGPENVDGFLTCMKLKRDRTTGIGFWHNQVIDIMHEYGATVQETGISKIGSERCLWWIQTFAQGALQQKCYMVGRNDFIYFFCFTTRFLSNQRSDAFDQITKTISFIQ